MKARATKVIACNMIRDEVECALRRSGKDFPVEWIEEGLHQSVSALRRRIQQALDDSAGFGRVLLCFGICGNMPEGLQLGDFELVMPDADDCISLLLRANRKEQGVIYETRGWLATEKNFSADYDRLAQKYGCAKARKAMSALLAGYHSLYLVDTGAYDLASTLPLSQAAAKKLRLAHSMAQGSVDWLCELFACRKPDSRRFLRFSPGETIQINLLRE
jgi:hypothetical protein